jgi:hypothetical protein
LRPTASKSCRRIAGAKVFRDAVLTGMEGAWRKERWVLARVVVSSGPALSRCLPWVQTC